MITHTIEVITPTDATTYLERIMDKPRTVRRGRVMQYARDMEAGRWIVNGEAVKFNGNGTVVDGVHRLTACVKANVAFTTLVIRGLETQNLVALDTGAPRVLRDVLRMEGYHYAGVLASTIRFCWRYDRDLTGFEHGQAATMQESLDYLQANPGLIDAAAMGQRITDSGVRIQRTIMASVYFLTWRIDADDANAFFEQLRLGVNLPEGNPILALRSWINKQIVIPRDKPAPLVQAAVLIKAVNAWREGRDIQTLGFRKGGANPERFPILKGEIE